MAVKPRRKAVVVDVGGVKVGGTHPIVVQSMTNTDTADVASTVNQVMALARAGSELVRVTVNTEAAAAAVPKIVDACAAFGVRVPIIGDFHYNGHLPLKNYVDRAPAAARYSPLPVDLTEPGIASKAILATSAAPAPVLQAGIGDTIRTSLTPMPNGDRAEEVIVSQEILQSLGIRSFTPQVTA